MGNLDKSSTPSTEDFLTAILFLCGCFKNNCKWYYSTITALVFNDAYFWWNIWGILYINANNNFKKWIEFQIGISKGIVLADRKKRNIVLMRCSCWHLNIYFCRHQQKNEQIILKLLKRFLKDDILVYRRFIRTYWKFVRL